MDIHRRAVLLLSLYTLFSNAVGLSQVAGPSPVIRFDPTAIEVSNVTKSRECILFIVSHEPTGYSIRLTQHAEAISDTDANGAVRFELPRAVPPESIWVAIDLTTGAASIASPRGVVQPTQLSASAVEAPKPGRSAHLRGALRDHALLYVRPGVAAWTARLDDGGVDDADGVPNGVAAITFERLKSIGGARSHPGAPRTADLLIVVDRRTLEVFELRLGPQP